MRALSSGAMQLRVLAPHQSGSGAHRLRVHEIKYHGYRMMLIRGHRVRLISRGGHDWAKDFRLIVGAALKLRLEHFVIDGEIVVLEKSGRV